MTDWNEVIDDRLVTHPPKNSRPTRPAKLTDNAPEPELYSIPAYDRYAAGMIERSPEPDTFELPLAQPKHKKISRGAALFWGLIALVPAPAMPALLIIPFAAGGVVFAWLLLMSGWNIGP